MHLNKLDQPNKIDISNKKGKMLRNFLHWFGSALALLGIFFVGMRIHSYSVGKDFSQLSTTVWIVAAGLSIIYGAANLFLAIAWRSLLSYLGKTVNWLWAIRTYGISQLAKYVPGNIFHLAGRQAIGMSAGVSGKALAKSTVWELGLIAIAGAIYGILVLPLLVPEFTPLSSILFLLGVVCGTAYLLHRIFSSQITAAFLWQTIFLAISAGLFVILLKTLTGNIEFSAQVWLSIGGAYVVAWLIGLITPGAPAGMGVRELVLLFLLNGMVAEADLLMAILLGRLVTVIGDVLFFAVALMIPAELRTA